MKPKKQIDNHFRDLIGNRIEEILRKDGDDDYLRAEIAMNIISRFADESSKIVYNLYQTIKQMIKDEA